MRTPTATALLLGAAAAAPSASSSSSSSTSSSSNPLPVRISIRSALNSRLSNVHISTDAAPDAGAAAVSFTYGACDAATPGGAHHTVGRVAAPRSADRLVWVVPEGAGSGGCVSAWADNDDDGGGGGGVLVGRSAPLAFDHANMAKLRRRGAASAESDGRQRRRRQQQLDPIAMTKENGIEAQGPWFDGVAFLAGRNVSAVDAAAAKGRRIAVVGAGMSGLMTHLVLSQAGFRNLSVVEASARLGGRVRTAYLSGGPWDYSYQEMGPMRFPSEFTYENKTHNISDHQLVFQLAAELNRLNEGRPGNLSVDFIPWIQSNDNGLVYMNGFKLPSGLPPTVAQIRENSTLGAAPVQYDAETAAAATALATGSKPSIEFLLEVAKNTFRAHKHWIESGPSGLPGDQWSQFAYIKHYLNASLNTTDVLSSSFDSFWSNIYHTVYFGASSWKTIDGGLNRLPLAFHPHVDGDLTLGRKIERVQYSATGGQAGRGEVTLQWRADGGADGAWDSEAFDYAVVAVPFSVVKGWRLPPLGVTISNAIGKVPQAASCKVALEYRSRFWERLERPIRGGCSTSSDIPGIGSVCYPSYNIGGSGPASTLASYNTGSASDYFASMPEEEHVRLVREAMVDIHGDVARDEYTGRYNRKCWKLDPLQVGAFASPTVGQMELYLPEYFKMHSNMAFIGEHTSYTHAWIASALESGIRGAVQIMLELGLVDEAKAAVDKWMARWMDV
ncbi:hypothetical protein RB601_006920 [Gaeumannomyces tritici]